MIFWERERVRRKWSKLNLIMVEIKPGERKMTRKKQMDNDKERWREKELSGVHKPSRAFSLCRSSHSRAGKQEAVIPELLRAFAKSHGG